MCFYILLLSSQFVSTFSSKGHEKPGRNLTQEQEKQTHFQACPGKGTVLMAKETVHFVLFPPLVPQRNKSTGWNLPFLRQQEANDIFSDHSLAVPPQ